MNEAVPAASDTVALLTESVGAAEAVAAAASAATAVTATAASARGRDMPASLPRADRALGDGDHRPFVISSGDPAVFGACRPIVRMSDHRSMSSG